jgi:hypothetical protein
LDLENDDFSVVGCTDTENEAEKARLSSKYVSYSKIPFVPKTIKAKNLIQIKTFGKN